MLENITVNMLFSGLLLFCRVGSMLMAMPGLGESYIPIRVRLLLSIAIAMALLPFMQSHLPPMPEKLSSLLESILIEIIIGIFFGSLVRIIISALHIVGMIIATMSGLSSAMLFDPNQGAQSAIVGNFMTMLAITFFFATNMDHILLKAIAESYSLFPASKWPLIGDITEMITMTLAKSFEVAIKIAMPQLVTGLILFIGAGVMARLMPAMQVFFIMMPIQILLSFFIVMVTLTGSILWYMDYVREATEGLLK